MRNLDKQQYRLKCRILARKIAKMRLKPHTIPDYLSKQKWFINIQGAILTKKGIKFAKGGAFCMFGREWCDDCMNKELIATGIYKAKEATKDPTDIDSYYEVQLID